MNRRQDWQLVLQLQIREIENRHKTLHRDLIDWGRWGRGYDNGAPFISTSVAFRMPGDYDPDLDEDAVPEPVLPPINEKRVLELDCRINDLERFPAVWRRVLCINYLGVKGGHGGYVQVSLEYKRPNAAQCSSEGYRLHLATALRTLAALDRGEFGA